MPSLKPSFLRRWLGRLPHYALGVLGCMILPLSIVVVGWSYRVARRSALRTWKSSDQPWPESLASEQKTPVWFGTRGHALRANGKLGIKALLCTFVLTLVPSLLMLFSWEAGWDNSFNKGYERSAWGPTTGALGIALFIVAMFYVPIAQARLAVTGEARSFFQFHQVRAVIRRQWLSCLQLAGGYALLSLPIMAMGSYLGLAAHETNAAKPNALSSMTPEEALGFLNRYFLFCCAYVFPAYLALRCWAARIYARGALICLQTGRWSREDLLEAEREIFDALDLSQAPPLKPSRNVRWLGNHGLRVAGGAIAILLWFAVSAQTYVTQFFTYQPKARWLYQPLIQTPWYRHIPSPLQEAVKEARAPELAQHQDG